MVGEKEVFDELPKNGYSETAAHSIWLWYHPTKLKKDRKEQYPGQSIHGLIFLSSAGKHTFSVGFTIFQSKVPLHL